MAGKRGQTYGPMSYLSTGPGTWLIALLVLAYVLANAGYSFLATVAVVLGFLLLVGGVLGAPGGGMPGAPKMNVSGLGGGDGPIVVNMGGPQMGGGGIPPQIRFQPDWGGPSSGESSVGKNLAHVANFMGKSIGYALGGKPSD